MKRFIFILTILFTSQLTLSAQGGLDSLRPENYIKKDLDTIYSELVNTGAKLKLPLYFEPFVQGEYYGYMHAGTATTIMGQMMDSTAFLAVTTNLNKDVFAKQGAELIEEMELKTLEGRPAKMYIIRFMAEKVPVNRMMFFTGDMQNTLLLTANYPELFASLLRDVILTSFMTVQYK